MTEDHNNDNDRNDNDDHRRREEGQVTLAEMIDHVGDELRNTAEQNKIQNENPVMRFKECQIEMGVEVTKTFKGGLNIWVFTLGADRAKTNTNTVTVTFEALRDGIVEFQEFRENP